MASSLISSLICQSIVEASSIEIINFWFYSPQENDNQSSYFKYPLFSMLFHTPSEQKLVKYNSSKSPNRCILFNFTTKLCLPIMLLLFRLFSEDITIRKSKNS